MGGEPGTTNMESSTSAEALIPRFKFDKILNQGLQSFDMEVKIGS